MAHLERVTRNPPWSFGGRTLLMLRIGHRFSKDIDLFVPDPQYLGFVNPRLSEVAEGISPDYAENAESIKLILDEGEIDNQSPAIHATPWRQILADAVCPGGFVAA